METWKVCGIVFLAAILSAFATLWFVEPLAYEAGIKKGKSDKISELATVFAPHGYEKIKGAKQDCEIKSGETCRIYGGFAPKSLFLPDQVPELKRQKL